MKVRITFFVVVNLCVCIECNSRPVSSVVGDALKWLLDVAWKKIQDYLPGNRRDVSPLDDMKVVHGFAVNVQRMLSSNLKDSTKYICINLYKKARNKLETMKQSDDAMTVFFKMTSQDILRFYELRNETIRLLDTINDKLHCEEERLKEKEEYKYKNFLRSPFIRN